MLKFLIQRIVSMFFTGFGVLTVVFFMVRALPGDPATYMLGDYATKETVAALRAQLGLNRPLPDQFLQFLQHALTGDLGQSTVTQQPALREAFTALPPSIELAFGGVAIAIVLGVPAGVLAATKRGTPLDYFTTFGTLAAMSVPVFWLGLLFILVFTRWLGILPSIGYSNSGGWPAFVAIIMPAVVLALSVAAYIGRFTRSAMLEVLDQDYIRVARAMGIRPVKIVWNLALRNAAIPIIAVIGVTIAFAIGNSILVEVVFSRPGIGTMILKAIQARDYQLAQAGVLILAVVVVLVNTVVDVFYGLVDPRVRKRAQ